MEVILNIGLNTNTNTRTVLEAIDAVQATADAGFRVISTEVFNSDTEPTLVVVADDLDRPGFDNRVFELARRLQQDCIALFTAEGYGDLLGPNAAAWGAFNPEFFILPTGERLAAQQARANRQAQFGAWAEQRRAA